MTNTIWNNTHLGRIHIGKLGGPIVVKRCEVWFVEFDLNRLTKIGAKAPVFAKYYEDERYHAGIEH